MSDFDRRRMLSATKLCEQRWTPAKLRSQRLDCRKRRRTDVVFHSFHVVLDHARIESEKLEEFSQ